MTPDWRSQFKIFYNDYTHVRPFTRKGLQNALIIHGFSNVVCKYFYQLPLLWKYPFLNTFRFFIAILPDSFKWKDKNQTKHIKLIRFSKERMLLSVGTKK